jgi:hypothetical protein
VADPRIKDLAFEALNLSLGSVGSLEPKQPLDDFLYALSPQVRQSGTEPSFDRLRSLSQTEDVSELEALLRQLQVSGSYGSNDQGYQYGGRIGYSMPVGENNLNLGVSGYGYGVETPFGRQSDRDLTGADVKYQFGPNTIGAKFDRFGALPGDNGPLLENLFRLTYQRQFD